MYIECLYILFKNINRPINKEYLNIYISIINEYYDKFTWENRTKFFLLSIIECIELHINMSDKDKIVKGPPIKNKNKKKFYDNVNVKDNVYVPGKNNKNTKRFRKKVYTFERRNDNNSNINKNNHIKCTNMFNTNTGYDGNIDTLFF